MAFTKEYFDEGIYRMGTRCEKWDELRQREGGGILPLWVADMDFPSPPAVQQALLAGRPTAPTATPRPRRTIIRR